MISKSVLASPGRRQRGPHALEAPVDVDERPVLLQERRRRQHDIGELGRARQEDRLADDELARIDRRSDPARSPPVSVGQG
jgi:hypothetical protein